MNMTMNELLKNAKGLCDDSRYAEPGFLFFCKGNSFKKEYLSDAIEKGILGYVAEKDFGFDIPHFITDDIRSAMADAAKIFYDDPSRKLELVGITGTKGKSTTLYYLKNIMENSEACGEGKFGYISTINNYDGKRIVESHLTTPEIFELNTLLSGMVDSGIKKAGMEVSSQGLKYGRIKNISYAAGAFTNFSEDHIGPNEHTDIEDYFNAKLSLMNYCENFIVNLDDERSSEVLAACKQLKASGKMKTIFTVSSFDKSDAECESVLIKNIQKLDGRTAFDLDGFGTLMLNMPGLFNIYNAAFAAILSRILGANNEEIKNGLLDAKASGRMEIYKNDSKDIIGIVDFAHNKLSFEKIFSSVKEEYPNYRIEAVFGCPGNKAPERREDLPMVAAKYSDYSYITEDDPFHESAESICNEVYQNLLRFGGNGRVIVDRKDAIKTAISNAEEHTVILFLAKGCDKYMHRENYDEYESDSVIVNEEIKNI